MLVRDIFEEGYRSIFEEERMGTTVWSPLCNGVLTGKYNDGIPAGSRFENSSPFLMSLFNKFMGDETTRKEKTKMLQDLGDLAKEIGCTQAQLGLAWVIVNKDVSTAILGCSSKAQLEENLGAIQVAKKLTPEILERIEKILNNRPTARFDWKNTWKNFPNRR
jgi:aryl-alcohol dehydrogenase-like predicted oxidoreductase